MSDGTDVTGPYDSNDGNETRPLSPEGDQPVEPQVADDMPHLSKTEWAQRRVQRSQERKSHSMHARFTALPVWQRWTLAVPAVLLALLIVLAGVEVAVSAGRVHPRVSVAGIGIGGLSPDRAAEKLESELGPRFDAPVILTFEDQSWSVEETQVAAALDTTAAIDAAMSIGRGEGFSASLSERLRAWFGPTDIAAPVSGDSTLVAGVLDTIAAAVDKEPQDAAVVIEGTTARVEPSVLGLAIRRDELARTLLEAFAAEDRDIEVGADFVPVQVTDEDAAQAAEVANRMMSGPVSVTSADETWDFSAEQIAGWIAFRQVPASSEDASPTAQTADLTAGPGESVQTTPTEVPGPAHMLLEAYIDSAEASKTITPHVGTAGKPAQDAEFKVSNGSVQIVPSQDGVGADIDALALEMTTVLQGDGERRVELRTMRVEPAITTADAQAMGIKERISTYTTTYDSGNRPRVNNIHTLADALDGTLVAPGETFSFNGTIGPRTAAKGYQEAPAIVNGQLVPQLGGGICQVGTTIFNAVFESGLPVVERKNHSFYISHYPKGRDATVSWGGPDFKFKNDTENWVLVATGYSNSSLTISIYGTDPGYVVTSSTGAWYDVTPHSVREIKDATMAEGARVVEDSGVDGRKIAVTRTVKKNGQVVREDKFVSIYKAKEEVVRVGTMPVSTNATATP